MPRRPALRPHAPPPGGELRRVRVDRIEVPAHRMRRDLGDVAALATSLGTYGQLAPVVCYEDDSGRLRLIAGERRLEATRQLHTARIQAGQVPPHSVAEIDVMVRQLASGQNPAELELIENEQRRELTDEEEADAFIQLARGVGHDLHRLAEMSGRSVAYVSKRIRVFEDPQLRQAVSRGELATSQAEELLALPEPVRADLVRRSVAEGWSHDRMRAAVRALSATPMPRPEPLGPDHFRVETPTDRTMGLMIERPPDLARRIRDLDELLAGLGPEQLTRQDHRALDSLARTLGEHGHAGR